MHTPLAERKNVLRDAGSDHPTSGPTRYLTPGAGVAYGTGGGEGFSYWF